MWEGSVAAIQFLMVSQKSLIMCHNQIDFGLCPNIGANIMWVTLYVGCTGVWLQAFTRKLHNCLCNVKKRLGAWS